MKLQHKLLKPLLWGLVAGLIGFGCQQGPSTASAASGYQPEAVQPQNTSNSDELLKPADRAFMKTAEDNDLRDRDLGREAAAKSTNPDIQAFAKSIVKDHDSDLQRAAKLMTDKGIHESKDMVAVNHKALTRLNKVSGQNLDRTFLELMIKDHQSDVASYRAEAQNGMDPAVRQYAADAVEELQKHLKKAEDLEGKL